MNLCIDLLCALSKSLSRFLLLNACWKSVSICITSHVFLFFLIFFFYIFVFSKSVYVLVYTFFFVYICNWPLLLKGLGYWGYALVTLCSNVNSHESCYFTNLQIYILNDVNWEVWLKYTSVSDQWKAAVLFETGHESTILTQEKYGKLVLVNTSAWCVHSKCHSFSRTYWRGAITNC